AKPRATAKFPASGRLAPALLECSCLLVGPAGKHYVFGAGCDSPPAVWLSRAEPASACGGNTAGSADLVRSQGRRYSPDERRCALIARLLDTTRYRRGV